MSFSGRYVSCPRPNMKSVYEATTDVIHPKTHVQGLAGMISNRDTTDPACPAAPRMIGSAHAETGKTAL